MTTWFRCALLGAALTMIGCEMSEDEGLTDEEDVWAEEALGPIKLANSTPLGLASTTNRLFWTSFETDPLGQEVAVLWSATKTNTPGSEIPLRTRVEPAGSLSYHLFQGIAIPPTGGSWLYYVQNDSDEGNTGSYVFRMSQTGGTPTLIGASSYVGDGPIVSDGFAVFWSDPTSIWRVLTSGALLSLAAATSSPALGVDGTFLYYATGNVLRRVRSAGGPQEVVATATAPVRAIHVDAARTVTWGEQNGAVRSVPAAGAPVTTYQAPIAGRVVTSVGAGSSRVMWIDCLSNGTDCAVRVSQGGVTTVVAAGLPHAGHLQWDATSVYWGQDGGLMKVVF